MIEIASINCREGAELPTFPIEIVKNEPMLFNCNRANAYRLGGLITSAWLDALPGDWKEGPVVIDTRVHMLMPGWYPCIPGWHHDDVPRTAPNGQPNYDPGQDRGEFCMALVGDDISRTEFALGHAEFLHLNDIGTQAGKALYEIYHREVEDWCAEGVLHRMQAPMNKLIFFDDRVWHRGMPATGSGWRWFGRVSRYFDATGARIDRRNTRTNEVRRQVQVYMSNVNQGW